MKKNHSSDILTKELKYFYENFKDAFKTSGILEGCLPTQITPISEVSLSFDVFMYLLTEVLNNARSNVKIIFPTFMPAIIQLCSQIAFEKKNVEFELFSTWDLDKYGGIMKSMRLLGNIQFGHISNYPPFIAVYRDNNELLLVPNLEVDKETPSTNLKEEDPAPLEKFIVSLYAKGSTNIDLEAIEHNYEEKGVKQLVIDTDEIEDDENERNYPYEGLVHESNGDFKSAIKVYKEGLKEDENNIQLLKSLATSYIELDDYINSKACFNKILSMDESNLIALYYIGLFFDEDRDYKNAKIFYKRALKTNPDHLDSLINLGLIYVETNQYQKGLDLLIKADSLLSENAEIISNIGYAYVSMGMYEKGIEKYKESLQITEDPITWDNIGVAYELNYQFDKAKEAYTKALELDPEDSEIKEHLEDLLAGNKKELDPNLKK